MDKAKGRALHQSDARTQRTQQADSSSLHQRFLEEVEIGPVKVFTLEVGREALIEQLSHQGVGKEVDSEETQRQVFADSKSPLVLKDERSS